MFLDLHEGDAQKLSSPMPAVQGTQWVGDLCGCQCDEMLLKTAPQLEVACTAAVRASGLHPVGHVFHQFEPGGATGLVLLAESHLAVHTWPERQFVSIDLYVCNFSEDNSAKASALFELLRELFQPEEIHAQTVARGAVRPLHG
jgi:S-adenosylmethionine decarboxylase